MQVELHKLTKQYLTKQGFLCAVDSLSWSGESGKVYGFLGPNGSGKTSTIKMLLDLIRPDSGQIEINGKKKGNRETAFRNSVGYLPEERGLYKKSKALDVLVYFGRLKGLSRHDAKTRAIDYLTQFGLIDYATAPLDSLSKGMTQKVQLILALINRPSLAILDEPFTGLDPINVRLVRNVISDLKHLGSLVIVCTHRMDEAERLCDDILMLRKGKIALCGSQRALREAHGERHISLAIGFPISHFHSIESVEEKSDFQNVTLRTGATTEDFLAELALEKEQPSELHITPISLEELYIKAVSEA